MENEQGMQDGGSHCSEERGPVGTSAVRGRAGWHTREGIAGVTGIVPHHHADIICLLKTGGGDKLGVVYERN